jgi:DNA-binding response OmpR family regulator
MCRRLRARDGDTPIIGLNVRDVDLARIRTLEGGPDDYLVTPSGPGELLARVEASLRRSRKEEMQATVVPDVVRHGSLHIDHRAREVRLDGTVVSLTRKEFELLALLASERGRVFARSRIMSEVWGEEWVGPSRTIDTHVSSLRSKLNARSWIVTVRGVGFRLD